MIQYLDVIVTIEQTKSGKFHDFVSIIEIIYCYLLENVYQ